MNKKPQETPHLSFSDETAGQAIYDVMTVEREIEIDYTNYRGERAVRKIIPWRLDYKTSEHHSTRQWMIVGWDINKQAWRSYPIKDIHNA